MEKSTLHASRWTAEAEKIKLFRFVRDSEGDEGNKPLSEFVNVICEEIKQKRLEKRKSAKKKKKDK